MTATTVQKTTIPPISSALRVEEILVQTQDDDPRLWVQPANEPGVYWRPLMIDLAGGNRVELLKVKRGGQLTPHLHPGPVHGYTIYGTWHYLEHEWIAHPGSYLFEAPGDCHTLTCGDCDEMMAVFFLSGPLLYVDGDGQLTGRDDNQTILQKARDHYESAGLGAEYAMQFVR